MPRPISVVVRPLVVVAALELQPCASYLDLNGCDGVSSVGNHKREPVVRADDDAVNQRAGSDIAGHGIPLDFPSPVSTGGLVQVSFAAFRAPVVDKSQGPS